MNSDLVKAGIYNQKVHKKIADLIKIRNTVAHFPTESSKYSKNDIKKMIKYINNFLRVYHTK